MFKVGDGQHPPIPERLSEEGQHFLKMCFVHDQRYRWTAHMLEDHPFVKVVKYSSIRCLFSFSCFAELKSLVIGLAKNSVKQRDSWLTVKPL